MNANSLALATAIASIEHVATTSTNANELATNTTTALALATAQPGFCPSDIDNRNDVWEVIGVLLAAIPEDDIAAVIASGILSADYFAD